MEDKRQKHFKKISDERKLYQKKTWRRDTCFTGVNVVYAKEINKFLMKYVFFQNPLWIGYEIY